jgi:4-hydroxy-3-methylbut-2-enyl diphosphate reductase
VELCERKFPTYFINSESEIISRDEIHHYDYPHKQHRITSKFLPIHNPVKIVLTSGASCPDTLVDRVMLKVLDYFEGAKSVEEVVGAKV